MDTCVAAILAVPGIALLATNNLAGWAPILVAFLIVSLLVCEKFSYKGNPTMCDNPDPTQAFPNDGINL